VKVGVIANSVDRFFVDWPAGADPLAVGTRAAEIFTSQSLASGSGHANNDDYKHYKDACAWYGSLAIAHNPFDDDVTPLSARLRNDATIPNDETEVEEWPECLEWREAAHDASIGVAFEPRSTISNVKPSAHSGSVTLMSNFDTSRSRARSSGIELSTGSIGINGSPGKYICVIRRLRKPVPNSEK